MDGGLGLGLGLLARLRVVEHPDDAVYTPPGEEHWHGATAGNFMSRLAMLAARDRGRQ
jgi:hypothetical protein